MQTRLSSRLQMPRGGRDAATFGGHSTPTGIAERLSGLSGRSGGRSEGDTFVEPSTAANLAEKIQSSGGQLVGSQPHVVEFGEWLPDRPEFANPGSTIAKNVIPHSQSYLPFPSFKVASQNAATGQILGIHSDQDTSGDTFIYAGDATKLYEFTAGTFNDESKGGGYNTGVNDVWEFVTFTDKGSADPKVIATNYTNAIQSMDIGGGSAGSFADHITSTLAPKAKHMGVVRNFLVLGGTNDATDGEVPERVWWSGVLDSDDFDPSATTLCDWTDLEDGGWVQRIIGGEYGVIFMEKQIVRMTFVGSPIVFRFDVMDSRRGTPIPNSVVKHGRLSYYISDEGFHVFDGSQSSPIGTGKVDRWFWSQFNISHKRNVSAAIDSVNKLVVWAFPGTGNTDGLPNILLMYRWDEQRWSYAEVDTQMIFRTQSQGYTLDELDAAFGTDIDDGDVYPISWDSDFYKGGGLKFGAVNRSNELGLFNGTSLEAVIDTKEVQLNQHQFSLVTELLPIADAADVTVQIGNRNKLSDTLMYDQPAVLNNTGFATVRNAGKYHRARLRIAADQLWTHAQGVEFWGTPTGRR